MLIKQLVLHNFRVFNGTHTIDLAPRKRPHDSNPRPIVLFGGLNGAGKTTLYTILCKCLFSEVTVQAVTELDNKTAHCHTPVPQWHRPFL